MFNGRQNSFETSKLTFEVLKEEIRKRLLDSLNGDEELGITTEFGKPVTEDNFGQNTARTYNVKVKGAINIFRY